MPNFYHIVVQGHLDVGWSGWFDGLAIRRVAHGRIVLAGPIRDQAELHGVLAKIRDLGLPLVALHPVAPERADGLEERRDDGRSRR